MQQLEVRSVRIEGWGEALQGLALSYNNSESYCPEERTGSVAAIATRLAGRDTGENKFLESIIMWVEVRGPRFWWQEFDTYRHVTKQSQSTMHTLTRRHLTQDDFCVHVPEDYMAVLNHLIDKKDWRGVKCLLPESFMQTRMVCMSLKTFQRMWRQRHDHRLQEWPAFLNAVLMYSAMLKEGRVWVTGEECNG